MNISTAKLFIDKIPYAGKVIQFVSVWYLKKKDGVVEVNSSVIDKQYIVLLSQAEYAAIKSMRK